jgi:hypothetical protein
MSESICGTSTGEIGRLKITPTLETLLERSRRTDVGVDEPNPAAQIGNMRLVFYVLSSQKWGQGMDELGQNQNLVLALVGVGIHRVFKKAVHPLKRGAKTS